MSGEIGINYGCKQLEYCTTSDHTHVQEHFSLMGECLDPELPEENQIEALLEHAERELSLTVNLQAPEAFEYARHSVKRAHLLNDFCTAASSAFSRLSIAWLQEDSGKEFKTEHAKYLALLTTALLPPLYKVEGRH
jgi:3-methyladenine DNA glycosylase AlkC